MQFRKSLRQEFSRASKVILALSKVSALQQRSSLVCCLFHFAFGRRISKRRRRRCNQSHKQEWRPKPHSSFMK